MKLTEASLRNPAAVAVAVALVCVFGLMRLRELPLQLFPDIDRPQMSVQTSWRAASPREIESEILEPQEEVLQGLPGPRADGRQREPRQQLGQPDVRGRHRHGRDAGRRARRAEPPAAAAARRDAAGRAVRRRRRQPQPDVVLRAAAARHARHDRRLPAVRGGHASSRGIEPCPAWRAWRSTAPRRRSSRSTSTCASAADSASRFPQVAQTRPRARPTSPAASSTSAAASTRCASPAATRPTTSAS